METKSISSVGPDPIFQKQSPFPSSHVNFIPTKVGKSSEINIKMRNAYEYPIVLEVESNSEHFRVSPSRIRLQPGEKISFKVMFEPKKTGTWFGMIVFTQSPDNTKQFFTVTGKGIK